MRKKVRQSEPVTYWKSMVDAITTLMMVILLILMFFVLNFLINKGENQDDYDSYDHRVDYDNSGWDVSPTPTPTPSPTPYVDHDNGGGGGGGETSVTTEPTEPTNPNEFDGFDRAAVFAVLIDEETEQIIQVPDIIFELFSSTGIKQTLSTHYPELVSYTQYATTEDGSFYLPEKIKFGTYYFHQLTEIPGYDFASDCSFDVDESHEWESPLIVHIPVGPSKNNIQVQINDATTGAGLGDVIFDVLADGDVSTPDGTIRYRSGSVVDVISCDETGYGLSSELYLGKYLLVPRNLPTGYAAPDVEERMVTLERRTAAGEYAPVTVMKSEKTMIKGSVLDEFDQSPIASMVYQLTSRDDASESRQFVTNTSGYFEILDLKKNTTYELREIDVYQGYMPSDTVITFTVDSLGYIEGSPVYNLDVTNRMIRVEINTVDRVLRTPLKEYKVTLTDESGKEIAYWYSDGLSHKVNGLDVGVYKLNIDGSKDETIIRVEDKLDIQKFSTTVMTTRSYVALAVVGFIILLVLGILIELAYKKLKKRKRKANY